MEGADSLRITSDSPIWAEHDWHPHSGIVVIVAVKKASNSVPYNIILTSSKEIQKNIERVLIDNQVLVN
jgi:hypothetical protein